MIIQLLIIATIITFMIDYSGFIQEMESSVSRILKIRFHIPKPFSCGLCMTFWTGLFYVIITDFTLINLGFVCIAAYSTVIINEVLNLIRDSVIQFIYVIRNLLKI